MNFKVLVCGDSGLLGQATLRHFTQNPACSVFGFSSRPFTPGPFSKINTKSYEHHVLDVEKETERLNQLIRSFKPHLIVNALAYVNLTHCENNPQKAQLLNTEVPAHLALKAKEHGAYFIHISSDQVFDGLRPTPYREIDGTNPKTQYGKTKLEGERKVLHNNPDALVVRTNIVGFRDWPDEATFAEWLCDVLWYEKPVTLFTDYVTSSMHVDDLTPFFPLAYAKKANGILHIAAQKGLSKFEFAKLLAEELGKMLKNAKTGTLAEAKLTPERPPFLALDVARAEHLLGKRCPTGTETVRRIAKDFKMRMKEEKVRDGHRNPKST